MSDLKLYVDSQYASPWAMSCFVVLREKSIAAEAHNLKTAAELVKHCK